MELVIDKTILNKTAHPNDFTKKYSGTIWPVSQTVNPLITSKNKPNVISVTGMLSKTNIGFKKAFNKPKIAATTIAGQTPATSIPGNK